MIVLGGVMVMIVLGGVMVMWMFTHLFSWLYMNETDPAGHLAWLVEQLQIAEDNGEKVSDGEEGVAFELTAGASGIK